MTAGYAFADYPSESAEWCDSHALARTECGCPWAVSAAPSRVYGVAETAETAETGPPRPRVYRADDLSEGEPTRWLARGLLPRGHVAVLVGAEGIGKSLWWVLIVAHVTTGIANPLLGLPSREPASVLLVLTEDTWGDVRARLVAAGADLARVMVLCEEPDGTGSPVFPRDLARVDEAAEQAAADGHPLALVIVDAWLDTVHHATQVRDPQQARQALHPWRERAARVGACVLLLGHTNRADSDSVRDLIGSTSALRQKARVLLFAAVPPGTDGVLYVGSDKANGIGTGHAVEYRIDVQQQRPATDDDPGTAARLRVIGATGARMGDHLVMWRQQQREAERAPSADDRAWTWLADYLAERGGAWPAAATQTDARGAGHNPERLARLLREHGGSAGPDEAGGPWVYRLPVSAVSAVSATPQTREPTTETADSGSEGTDR